MDGIARFHPKPKADAAVIIVLLLACECPFRDIPQVGLQILHRLIELTDGRVPAADHGGSLFIKPQMRAIPREMLRHLSSQGKGVTE